MSKRAVLHLIAILALAFLALLLVRMHGAAEPSTAQAALTLPAR